MSDESSPPTDAPAAPPPRASEPLWDRVRKAPTTFAICAVNVVVFLVVETHGGSTDTFNLVRFGANERSHVWAGEYWRFVTPMFLHIGWIHLLWNTYALVGWCSPVERALGWKRFLLVYLLSGIGANAASLLCHDAPGAAGASGAAFGIVAVTMALRWRVLGSWDAFVADRWVRSTGTTIVLWTVLGFTAISMDNFAHGGGFVTGAAMGALYVAGARWTAPQRIVGWSAFAVALLATAAAAAHRWPGERSLWARYDAEKRGEDAIRRGDAAAARAAFDDASAFGDDSATLHFNRGLALEALGEREAAKRDYERALDAPPEEANAAKRARGRLDELADGGGL